MKQLNFDTVLFDLDGTLIDSIPGILRSFRHVKERFAELHHKSDAELVNHIGRPFIEFMLEAGISRERAAEIVSVYMAHNRDLIPEMPLYPGVRQTIERLRQVGFKTGIVTSKSKGSTEISIRAHDLESLFDVVVAKEDTETHKPDPTPLRVAMQRICSIPKHSIYVGDTIYDIKAAHAAGCSSIGAAWGAMNLPLLKSAEPTWLLDHFTQVGNLLE